MRSAAEIQQAYYADKYDELRNQDGDEHGLGLAYMLAMIEFFGIGSVLDVGSGTGFTLLKLKEKMPHIRAVGIEPYTAQRVIGYGKGLRFFADWAAKKWPLRGSLRRPAG